MIACKFQERYTEVQIYVWHCETETKAKEKFRTLVVNPDNWIFLGTTTI